jgi:phenylacetic acid degradation operon negative regulatory protein
MNEQHPFLTPLIGLLHGESRLRVWSVVITIFGDAVLPRGGRIAMSDLQDISGRMGIEGNALRTAMSRLAKEGWVTRDKQGRNSFYSLSDAGHKTFIPATERIYQLSPPKHTSQLGESWTIAIPHPGARPPEGGLILKGAALFSDLNDDAKSRLEADEHLLVSGNIRSIPDWVKGIATPADVALRYDQLAQTMTNSMRIDHSDLDPLDALAARCLVIHHWRRIVLRHPQMPHELTPNNWPGERCASLVAAAYQSLLIPSERWWKPVTEAQGIAKLSHRFRQHVTE